VILPQHNDGPLQLLRGVSDVYLDIITLCTEETWR
jgi:hypothetical protein